ncbi:MAG: hypothetical protein AAFY82_02360 [Pseudomonadota bacterium]
MAAKTVNGVTTLTPTAWKWFVGAALISVLIPPFGLLIALVFVLTGFGILQRLTLSQDGIKIRNWVSEKTHAWSEIEDFRIHRIKSGLFTAANMVSFTHVNQQGTMLGKAAKLLAGGTHSIPAIGMKPQRLILLMQAYKAGHVPADTAVPETLTSQSAPETLTSQSAPETSALNTPAMGAPAPLVRQAPETARPRAVPATPRADAPSPKPDANVGGRGKAATPLVQDGGGWFGRRRSDSPFQS